MHPSMKMKLFLPRSVFLWCCIMFIASWALYANTLANGFAFDDKSLIVQNTFLKNQPSLATIFTTNYRAGAGFFGDGLYRPLVVLTYILNAGTPLSPFPFHLFNITLNAANASLLFLLVMKLFGNLPLAVLSGCIFGLHPIHTEAVANIAGRPELMWVFFLLIAWLILDRFSKRWWSFPIVALLYLASLLSKETAVMFPCILLAVDYGVKKSPSGTHAWKRYGVLAVTVGVYVVIRWLVLGDTTAGFDPEFADNPIAHVRVVARIATAFVVLVRYAVLLIFPFRLSADYSYNQIPIQSSLFHAAPGAGILLFAGMIALALSLRNRHPVLLFSLIVFLFPYLLISNLIIPVGTIMGERLMYFPSAGYAIAAGYLLTFPVKRWRIASLACAAVILSMFALKTATRNRDWRNDDALFAADLRNSPRSVKVLCNMGYLTGKRGLIEESMGYFHRALELYPEYGEALKGYGKRLYDLKRYEESAQYYARAVSVSPKNAEFRNDYGIVLEKIGRFDEAEAQFTASMRLNPSNPVPYQEMSSIMIGKGEFQKALDFLRHAAELGGDPRIILNNSAVAEYLSGNLSGAYELLLRAESQGIAINEDLSRTIRASMHQR